MSAPTIGPCETWATEADLCSPCADEYDAEGIQSMLEVASFVLYELSGRQFPGECQTTLRPCTRPHGDKVTGDRHALSASGSWTAWSSQGWCGCSAPDNCGCRGISQIQLSSAPIASVEEVWVDGVKLASNEYRVDDYRWLVRLPDADGRRRSWPCCQHLDRDAASEEGTFEVSFTQGLAPPEAGVHAAAVLACELFLACDPETRNKCRLPKRVTSVVRQGVALMAIDPMNFLDKGRTGLLEVDLFLAAANPKGNSRQARVLSPDLPPFGRRAGT